MPIKILSPIIDGCANHLILTCLDQAEEGKTFSKDLADFFCKNFIEGIDKFPRQSDFLNGVWSADRMLNKTGKDQMCRAIELRKPFYQPAPKEVDVKIEDPVEHPQNEPELVLDNDFGLGWVKPQSFAPLFVLGAMSLILGQPELVLLGL